MQTKSRVRLATEYLEDRTQPAHLSLGLEHLLAVQPLLTVETLVLTSPHPAAPAQAASSAAGEPAAILVVFEPTESVSIVIEPAAAAKPIPASTFTGTALPVSTTPAGVESAGAATSAAAARSIAANPTAGASTLILLPPDANPQPTAPTNAPPALGTTSLPAVLALAAAPASSTLSTYSALTTAVGGVNGGAVAAAPAPHEANPFSPAGPAVDAAPPPREAASPAAEQTTSVGSMGAVSHGAAVPITASQPSRSTEQPEPLMREWGWVGAVAAAVVAGGYWVLHRARAARLMRNLRRWNLKTLPSGTILSTDFEVA